jgi:LysM repeat protein
MGIKQWPAALRAAGIQVREVNGFPGNDRGRPMPNRPAAVFWHHDATPKGSTPGALGWITQSYNSGAPSAQIWVDYEGVWYFVGSGYASHAGVTRGPLDSSNSIGIETDHTGPEVMSAALLRSMHVGLAAVCQVEGRRADFVTFHKIEAKPRGRKIDPYFSGEPNDTSRWDGELAQQRSIIDGIIDGSQPAPPPEEELTVAQIDDLNNKLDALTRSVADIRNAVLANILPNVLSTNAQTGADAVRIDATLRAVQDLIKDDASDDAKFAELVAKVQQALGEAPEPPPVPQDKRHTVVAGDTLGKIASQYGTTVEQIVQWNGLTNPDSIEVGQSLIVGKA